MGTAASIVNPPIQTCKVWERDEKFSQRATRHACASTMLKSWGVKAAHLVRLTNNNNNNNAFFLLPPVGSQESESFIRRNGSSGHASLEMKHSCLLESE